MRDWKINLAEELHKPIKCNFPRRGVILNNIDDIFALELVDMSKFSQWNRGYKYLLMVIDVFSKYGWIKPLKDKTGKSITNAFKQVTNEDKRKPKFLWDDKGKEFHNKTFIDFLHKIKITLYSTENEQKSSVVERWNRTIKN